MKTISVEIDIYQAVEIMDIPKLNESIKTVTGYNPKLEARIKDDCIILESSNITEIGILKYSFKDVRIVDVNDGKIKDGKFISDLRFEMEKHNGETIATPFMKITYNFKIGKWVI